MSARIVVIGGGIIGCAVAFELAGRGAAVRIVEARDVGLGATQASAGILAPGIEGCEDSPLLKLGVRSLGLFDEFVERIRRDSGAAVAYERTGTLETAADAEALSRLESTAAGHARAGVDSRLVDGAGARELVPGLSESIAGGLFVPAHGFVAAGALTAALARCACASGAELITSRTALTIRRDDDGLCVETHEDRLPADAVVLAAGSWSGQITVVGAAPPPVRPVRGQLLRLALTGPPLGRVVWGAGCYLVPWPDGSLLAGATVEEVGFDERATVAGVADLLDAACELLPRARQAGFVEARAGLRPASPDELPIVGEAPGVPGLVYATGHYRNGILLAPLTAQIVSSLVLDGVEDPALDVMSPRRFESAG